MNIPLLRQIQAQIVQHPETFAIENWECGTTACIAGWACRLTRKPIPLSNEEGDFYSALTHAYNVLEVDTATGMRLFHISNWPHSFQLAYRETNYADRKAKAKITVARIDHFIATGGAE
jgi:hypothetical protein